MPTSIEGRGWRDRSTLDTVSAGDNAVAVIIIVVVVGFLGTIAFVGIRGLLDGIALGNPTSARYEAAYRRLRREQIKRAQKQVAAAQVMAAKRARVEAELRRGR